MNLEQLLKKVIHLLKEQKGRYALAGGLVASIYRVNERLTKDIDFLFLSEPKSLQKAQQIIEQINLTPHIIRKADLAGGPLFAIKSKKTEPYMVLGRGTKDDLGLDFILPSMPWFESALIRAEHNEIDFGFARIPCLTVEDLIISKLFSYQQDQSRFNDLDDLKSIFQANHTLDCAYLTAQMNKLEITVPKTLKTFAPDILKKFRTPKKRQS